MALALLGAPSASAQQAGEPDGQGTDHFVTIVARQCLDYQDITANRARNNIQESLRDLSVDTPYTAGQEVDFDTEEQPQPNCTPLDGWRFTIGNAIATNRVTGVWGSLSVVSGADPTNITTLPSIPRRDNNGHSIPGQTVQAGTTIELTQAQLTRSG